jgi:hypothetical protein
MLPVVTAPEGEPMVLLEDMLDVAIDPVDMLLVDALGVVEAGTGATAGAGGGAGGGSSFLLQAASATALIIAAIA